MNDAPPVTSAVFPAQNDSVVATPRLPPDSLARPDVFENFQIFLKLGHSIIGGCGGPCRRFHRLQLPPVRHQVPDHADEFPVVVRIGSYRKALRSEEHTSELQSLRHLVCRLLLEKKKKKET